MKMSNKVRTLVREGAIVLFISVFCVLLSLFCDKISESSKRADTEPVANSIVETTQVTSSVTTTSSCYTTTTTTSTTTTVTTTTTTTTTITVTKPTITTTKKITVTTTITPTTTNITETTDFNNVNTETEGEFIGTFKRGTYYAFGSVGGSGRKLVSGYSIASRALYDMYGYGDYKIRIECDRFPQLNGIYSLDDCSAKGNNQVIDFWFAPNEVPDFFRKYGVLEVRAYIIR